MVVVDKLLAFEAEFGHLATPDFLEPGSLTVGQREARAQWAVASRGRPQSGRISPNVDVMAGSRMRTLSR